MALFFLFFFFAGSARLDLYFPRGDSLATDFPQEPGEKKRPQAKIKIKKTPLSGFPGYPITRELEYDRDLVGMAPTVLFLGV